MTLYGFGETPAHANTGSRQSSPPSAWNKGRGTHATRPAMYTGEMMSMKGRTCYLGNEVVDGHEAEVVEERLAAEQGLCRKPLVERHEVGVPVDACPIVCRALLSGGGCLRRGLVRHR